MAGRASTSGAVVVLLVAGSGAALPRTVMGQSAPEHAVPRPTQPAAGAVPPAPTSAAESHPVRARPPTMTVIDPADKVDSVVNRILRERASSPNLREGQPRHHRVPGTPADGIGAGWSGPGQPPPPGARGKGPGDRPGKPRGQVGGGRDRPLKPRLDRPGLLGPNGPRTGPNPGRPGPGERLRERRR